MCKLSHALLGFMYLKHRDPPQHHCNSLFFFIFVLHEENSVEYLKAGTILQGCCQEGILS